MYDAATNRSGIDAVAVSRAPAPSSNSQMRRVLLNANGSSKRYRAGKTSLDRCDRLNILSLKIANVHGIPKTDSAWGNVDFSCS